MSDRVLGSAQGLHVRFGLTETHARGLLLDGLDRPAQLCGNFGCGVIQEQSLEEVEVVLGPHAFGQILFGHDLVPLQNRILYYNQGLTSILWTTQVRIKENFVTLCFFLRRFRGGIFLCRDIKTAMMGGRSSWHPVRSHGKRSPLSSLRWNRSLRTSIERWHWPVSAGPVSSCV